jgi:hypothetical protein
MPRIPGNSNKPIGTQDQAQQLARPKLNEWSKASETKLSRSLQQVLSDNGMQHGDVMLVGPNEFVAGHRAGGVALHIYKDDPDDVSAKFQTQVGQVDPQGRFTPMSAQQASSDAQANTSVVGDASTQDATAARPLGGGIAARLGGGDSVLFGDLPADIQAQVKEHMSQLNQMEAMSMSPQSFDFLGAKQTDSGFDVTFRVTSYMGQEVDKVSKSFAAQQAAPAPATDVGGPVTSLDQLPAGVRSAVEDAIGQMNKLESMAMSPRTFSLGSAQQLSDGGWDVKLAHQNAMGQTGETALHLDPAQVGAGAKTGTDIMNALRDAGDPGHVSNAIADAEAFLDANEANMSGVEKMKMLEAIDAARAELNANI